MDSLQPRPAIQILAIDIAAVARSGAKDNDYQMIVTQVTAGHEARAGSEVRAGLDSVKTLDLQKLVRVRPGDGT